MFDTSWTHFIFEIYWLKLAWASLIMSLGVIVFSFLVSQQKLRNELQDLKDQYEMRETKKRRTWYLVTPRFCNVASGILMLLGFGFLAIFAIANIE